MPRIEWPRLQSILLCLVLLLVLLLALGWVLAQISRALLLFVLAAVLALVVVPLVDWGERHHLPRWLAAIGTYVLFAVVFLGGLFLLLAPLVREAAELGTTLPGYLAALNAGLGQLGGDLAGTPFGPALEALRSQVRTPLADWSVGVVRGLVGFLSGAGGSVADSLLVLIISLYLLVGGRQIHEAVLRLLPAPYRSQYLYLTGALTQVVGDYIRSQLVLALLLGVAVTVGLSLLGLPYALLLGVLATVLGLIPMFGSALSAVPALLVALTQPFPTVLWVLLFFIVVQNVQDQVLAPRIQARSVGLHPLAVMFALLAGAQLAGPLGALLALPVAGFVWIVLVAVYRNLAPDAEPGVRAGPSPDGVTAASAPPGPTRDAGKP